VSAEVEEIEIGRHLPRVEATGHGRMVHHREEIIVRDAFNVSSALFQVDGDLDVLLH